MKTSDFYFDLPQKLIAQKPADRRGDSRLLVLEKESGSIVHSSIKSFPDFLDDGSLIVVNNSKVRKARIFGFSEHGGKVQFLLVRKLNPASWEAVVSKGRKQKVGKSYSFPGGVSGVITGIGNGIHTVSFSMDIDDRYLDIHGHMPLPPYIRREDNEEDSNRYQTVYAEKTGSVAAPTAGLHFTEDILETLAKKDIKTAPVTLHVGLGTFSPVRADKVEDHKMHSEEYEITEETADAVNRAKKEGRKIVAVGTTSVRTIESAWNSTEGVLKSGVSSTDIYIYPGFQFKATDQLLTNFHTPDSSLILLVSAFAGTQQIRKAYSEAIKQEYRFFSYGDAMFIK